MLPFKCRLKKKKDFENVFKSGKGFKEDSLYFKIKKNNLKNSRFCFVVGKNISKKAVERNKIKRQLREIIKKNLDEIKINADCVLIVMPGAESDYNKLEKIVNKLFKKAGL